MRGNTYKTHHFPRFSTLRLCAKTTPTTPGMALMVWSRFCFCPLQGKKKSETPNRLCATSKGCVKNKVILWLRMYPGITLRLHRDCPSRSPWPEEWPDEGRDHHSGGQCVGDEPEDDQAPYSRVAMTPARHFDYVMRWKWRVVFRGGRHKWRGVKWLMALRGLLGPRRGENQSGL